ncbi:MAG: glycosyltransferase [Saprospiraceae bacterium]
MKLLILTSRFPYPLEKGDKLRMYFQIRELSRYHEIVLCALTEHAVGEAALAQLRPFCTAIHLLHRKKWWVILNLFLALFNRRPFQVAWFFDARIRAKIQGIARREMPDHIYCQLIRTAEYARGISVPKTLDYMDNFSAWSRKIAGQAPFPVNVFWWWEARKVATFEKRIFGDFDHHTIISRQDREGLGFKEKEAIHCVPNGVDTAYFQPRGNPEIKYSVAFTGNMGYYNNVKAAVLLVEKIMPLVWTHYPEAKVLIGGARPAPEVKNLESSRVVVSGWMDDIREAYASSAIFVAPIMLAVGLQNKILEAMAMGVPCITTPGINKAVGAIPDEEILLAGDNIRFAGQIIALLADAERRQRVGRAGQIFVRKNFSWQQAVQRLNYLMTEQGKPAAPQT